MTFVTTSTQHHREPFHALAPPLPVLFPPMKNPAKGPRLPAVKLGISSICRPVYRGRGYASVPTTLPPSVPSIEGPSLPPVTALSASHSWGVWHFALQAWISAISSLSAVLTSRCRLRLFLPANSGETMREVNAWPQPPVVHYNMSLVSWSRGFKDGVGPRGDGER
jgi:hypothetical protein